MEEKVKKEQITEESKVIAEINFEAIDPREQFLMEYNNCPLCGTELYYTHNTDFIYLDVKEEAHCPHCNIKTKTDSHRLQ